MEQERARAAVRRVQLAHCRMVRRRARVARKLGHLVQRGHCQTVRRRARTARRLVRRVPQEERQGRCRPEPPHVPAARGNAHHVPQAHFQAQRRHGRTARGSAHRVPRGHCRTVRRRAQRLAHHVQSAHSRPPWLHVLATREHHHRPDGPNGLAARRHARLVEREHCRRPDGSHALTAREHARHVELRHPLPEARHGLAARRHVRREQREHEGPQEPLAPWLRRRACPRAARAHSRRRPPSPQKARACPALARGPPTRPRVLLAHERAWTSRRAQRASRHARQRAFRERLLLQQTRRRNPLAMRTARLAHPRHHPARQTCPLTSHLVAPGLRLSHWEEHWGRRST